MRVLCLFFLLLTACIPDSDDALMPGDEGVGRLGKSDSYHHFSRDEIRGMLAVQQLSVDGIWCQNASDECASLLKELTTRTSFSISDLRRAFSQAQLNELERIACDLEGLCEPEFSIVTWNLRNFPLSEMTLAEVAAQVIKQQPDIIGFQEIDDKYAYAELLSMIPGYDGFPGWSGYGTRVAILYKQSRMQVTGSENLFVGERSAFPRPALHVRFSLKGRAADKDLSVVVVHLKAQIDARSQARRKTAITKLDEWVENEEHAKSTFLIGDFNDSIIDEEEDDVFSAFRDEARYELLTAPLEEEGAYSYIVYKAMLDHIVATEDAVTSMPVLSVDSLAMEETLPSYLSDVSDHRPVASRHVPIIPAQ